MSQGWLGVVSAEHVARGARLGFAQINHGKKAPLARMRAGDTLIYYSPTVTRGIADGYRSFTAIGVLPDDDIWQADEGSFQPYRRRLIYRRARHVSIADLRHRLALTAEPAWGYQLRLGLIKLGADDVAVIREAMTQ